MREKAGTDTVAVLVLDEDGDVRHLFGHYVEHLGTADLTMCATAADALRHLEDGLQPDVAFLDLCVTGAQRGADLCRELRRPSPRCLIYCMCNSVGEARSHVTADLAIEAFIEKPFSFKLALTRARSALVRQRREPSMAAGLA